MTKKPDQGTDPAEFVDAFTAFVGEWRDWYRHYKEEDAKGNSWPTEGPYKASTPWEITRMDEFDKALKAQDEINVMMLAAIDALKMRLNVIERR